MQPVDAAWFHMDGAVNTAVVTALVTSRRAFDARRVRDLVERRLAPLPVFHRRVADAVTWTGAPAWIDVPDLDVDLHVHHRVLPQDTDDAALRAYVEELASQPLPERLPPWQLHVIDGPGERGAVVFRYHHCLGDGAAMMAVAMQVFDMDPSVSEPANPDTVVSRPPPSVWDDAVSLARTAVVGGGSLLGELLRSDDPASPLKGPFTMRQRLAWSRPLALLRLKRIAHAFDASLNDLAVAAIAGALRGYAARSMPVAPATLRAMVPVSLRAPGSTSVAGNEFGLVMLELPVDLETPRERLQAAAARMRELKGSPEALAMRGLFDLFGRGPRSLQQVAQHLFGSKCSLVLTNVAGPMRTLRLAGRAVDRLMFWVPHPGEDLGLGASVCSYRGRVTFGIVSDARRLPDPERIVEDIEAEIIALDLAARRQARPRRSGHAAD